jgi:hypothetical protein
MRNNITNFLFLVLITTSFSVVAKDDVIKIYDKGLDGSERHYTVVCPNGTKTNVTHMLGEYGKAKRKRGSSISSGGGPGLPELPEEPVISETGKVDDMPSEGTSSIKQTAQNLKRRVLNLVGAKNRLEVCLFPINKEKQCGVYESVDTAAKAACNL